MTTETSTYQPSRPYMTADELRTHHVADYGRDYRESDDGWSDMEAESSRGWTTLSAWGRDGWNLGDWPYVSMQVRHLPDRDGFADPRRQTASNDRYRVTGLLGPYQLLQIVEGDRSLWAFDSQDDLYAALDYLFNWYSAGEDWSPVTYENRADLDAGALRIPLMFRGPYRTEPATA